LATPTGSDSYLLATPRNLKTSRPAPLVLLFHGFGSNPQQFSSLTGLPSRGARAGDVVAAPHLLPNDTEWQFSGHGTDAAYVHELIASLEGALCING
jgi:poly(3-hydroxybutyrate) depolymerase